MNTSSKKNVLVNSALYTFGNLLLKVFSFFLIPLYTTYLLPEQYGILNLATSFTGVFSVIMSLGLQFAVIRFYTDFKDEKRLLQRMFGTIINSIIIFSFIIGLLLYLTEKYWIDIFFENIKFYPIVFLSILISGVTSLYTVYQDSLKGMQQSKKSVTLTYIFFFLLLGANLITVVRLKMGAIGILFSIFIVTFLMIVVMIVDLKRQRLLCICIDKGILKAMLKYSLPIVPHSMSYTITGFITRIIINTKLALSSLGLYSLAFQFGNISDVALNSVQSAFQPWFFEKLKNRPLESKRIEYEIRDTSYLLMWLYGLMYIIIASFSKEAVNLMAAPSYHSAWIYVPAMVSVIAIKSPLYFYNNFLFYNKNKTKFIFATTFTGCVINVIMTLLLIPTFGIFGPIIADAISFVIRTLIVYPIISKEAKEIYSFVRLTILSIIPIVFIGIACLPTYLKAFNNPWIELLYKTGILFIYSLFIFFIYKNRLIPYLKRLRIKIK